jgi:acetylornithine/N-succinyldiaminopimelate aminotransferase
LAKGLAGGFPIGAAWMSDKVAPYFQPGSHGSTFGGNPMACAAALSVIEVIEMEGLLERVRVKSQKYHQDLQQLVQQFPNTFEGFRGQGYLMGLVLKDNPATLIEQLRGNGLLTVPAAGNVIRLLPPLTVSAQELQTSLDILQKTLSSSPLLESIPTS